MFRDQKSIGRVIAWFAAVAVIAAGVALTTPARSQTQKPYEGTSDDFAQISQLFALFHYGVNMRDPIARANAFTSDGVFQSPTACDLNMGRASNPAHKPLPTMKTPPPERPGEELRNIFPMSITGPIVYQDRDHASVHSIGIAFSEVGPEKKYTLTEGGVYDDKLVRVNGKWKFAYRFYQKRMPPGFKPVACPPQEQNGFKFYMFP